ncbi:hypothetical protein BJV78DRAFT_1198303 [Lactifluus subvellereus]|nr:hypothetical protein BJV78DRAFT_1198303 [Lactifluus subvellereus]
MDEDGINVDRELLQVVHLTPFAAPHQIRIPTSGAALPSTYTAAPTHPTPLQTHSDATATDPSSALASSL